MVMEAYDVSQFLNSHPLLADLSKESHTFLLNHLQITFSRAGKLVVLNTEPPAGLLILRSGSVEIRDQSNELKDRLSEGDIIFPLSLKASGSEQFTIKTLEDSLYYQLDDKSFSQLYKNEKTIQNLHEIWESRYQARTYSDSIVHASPSFGSGNASDLNQGNEAPTESHSFLPHWNAAADQAPLQKVSLHMNAPIVTSSPETSIAAAAKLMLQNKVSALLVVANSKPVGIVTDKDLRNRVLAVGVSPEQSLLNIMTPTPFAIDSSATLHDAQMLMMAKEIHHLVVMEKNQPCGMITAGDIFKASNLEPLPLMSRIKKAVSLESLIHTSKLLPDLVTTLIERNSRPSEIGQIITAFTDATTRRLIVLAQNQFGTAPCSFSWLAFGSQARQEQMLGSDQDNALILGDDFNSSMGDYFAKFSQWVNDGLDACGIVHCPGEIMAGNSKWRMTLTEWKMRFDNWIEQPDPSALMHASIFFDMRTVTDEKNLQKQLQKHVLEKAQKNTIFLAHMTGNALQHRPPLGFFKNFVLEHNGDHIHQLDLKKRGTIPVVDIARNYSLANGIAEVNTVARLRAMYESKAMSSDMANSLIDAHEFIAGLRLAAQAEEYRQHVKVDNYLNPKNLSPLQRQQLKEAFQWVQDSQKIMQARFYAGIQ